MRASALVLACALCTSSARRVRAGIEELHRIPNRTQLKANSSFDVLETQSLSALLLAFQNPAVGWQGAGHGQRLAVNKHRGKLAGSRAQIRLQAPGAAQRRFSYQPRPSSGSGYRADSGGSYRADSGQRPRRREARDFTEDSGQRPHRRESRDFSEDSRQRPRRRESRDFTEGGFRPRRVGGDDFIPDNDDMDGAYERRPSGNSYRADSGYRPPQRHDDSGKFSSRVGSRRREPATQRSDRGGHRSGDQDEEGEDLQEGINMDSYFNDGDQLDFGLSGEEYVYGVSPVLAALRARRREIKKLYMQSNFDFDKRKDMSAMREIVQLAEQLGVEVEERDKGFLCRLCNHRPHQGLVLEAIPLEREPMQMLPTVKEGEAPLWLALDEVTDPMNFGSLLRTAFFLGVDGVVMSKRNCAPLTPVVSKTSAGAMEIMRISEVQQLPKTLEAAKEAGWQVVGTALENAVTASELNHTAPTVLVLGNEGHGLRTNVMRACSKMVRIPRGACGALTSSRNEGLVDSMNVGVAGGVLLHSLLEARGRLAA